MSSSPAGITCAIPSAVRTVPSSMCARTGSGPAPTRAARNAAAVSPVPYISNGSTTWTASPRSSSRRPNCGRCSRRRESDLNEKSSLIDRAVSVRRTDCSCCGSLVSTRCVTTTPPGVNGATVKICRWRNSGGLDHMIRSMLKLSPVTPRCVETPRRGVSTGDGAKFGRRSFTCWARLLLLGVVISAGLAYAQDKDQGTVVVQVLGDSGKQSEAKAQIYAEGNQTPVATVKPGTPVNVPPGSYRLELDVLGGKVSRDKILVRAGRTSTVIINEVAGLRVNVLDKKGNDLGLTVEVYDSVSGQKLGDFLSGETIFAYPGMVDVKVGVPPQAQWWRKVELHGNSMAALDIKERVQGELRVHPLLAGRDISTATQVIIYEAGTQKEVARSEPGREHRFALDAGAYDIFVANPTGQGKPFVTEQAEVKGEETVEKDVPLDTDSAPATPAKTQTL